MNTAVDEATYSRYLALQEETGKFGTLLYAGVDWKDKALARNSMVLMAEKVLPLINR